MHYDASQCCTGPDSQHLVPASAPSQSQCDPDWNLGSPECTRAPEAEFGLPDEPDALGQLEAVMSSGAGGGKCCPRALEIPSGCSLHHEVIEHSSSGPGKGVSLTVEVVPAPSWPRRASQLLSRIGTGPVGDDRPFSSVNEDPPVFGPKRDRPAEHAAVELSRLSCDLRAQVRPAGAPSRHGVSRVVILHLRVRWHVLWGRRSLTFPEKSRSVRIENADHDLADPSLTAMRWGDILSFY